MPSGEQSYSSAEGTPLLPPLIVKSVMGSYPEQCAKPNFYLCPLAIRILEKRIVSLVVQPTILQLQIRDQDSH